jgi:hypothetical protein
MRTEDGGHVEPKFRHPGNQRDPIVRRNPSSKIGEEY